MDKPTLLGCVAEAAAHIQDYSWLASSPLVRLVPPGEGNPGGQLSELLAKAIRQLRPPGSPSPGSPDWRQYRHLLMRYILGASPKQIAQELNVSDRQNRRDHLDGLQALGELLWRRCQQQSEPRWSSDETGLALVRPGADAEVVEHDEAVQAEVSRIGITPSSGPTMVEETVRGALATVGRLAASRGITFDTRFPAGPCFVASDHAVLRQILLNLLTLIIESHADACVHLSIGDGHERVELHMEVASAGAVGAAGRDEDPTPSADPEDSRLTICRRLLAMQGGGLRLADAAGHHGIHLWMPAIWTATVLVVDDNPDFVRLFQRYLDDRAYRVHHANTAEKALRLAQEVRPDVITLDVMMPSQDGWETLQALKSHQATQDIPVIVCSVLREEALARSLGAAAFLTKPVRQPALLAALERCCADSASAVRRG